MDFNEQKILEQQAGRKAARKLRSALRNLVKRGFETTQGNSAILKSTVLAKMDGTELQRLVIKMPHYGFKHHFGFDGVRSNGLKLRLYKQQGFLNKSITEANVLEQLADDIAEIRGEQMMKIVTF
ncbi:MAG: hypothetical protein KGV59_01395 [Tenacibaculum sp.]|nr:hypothetical protein [Tenacibaculum sp.]